MLNIGRGWLVPVTMLNIGRGRRRERPKDTSKGVTTGVAQLLVAHAHTQGNLEEKTEHAQNIHSIPATDVTSGHVTDVTSGNDPPIPVTMLNIGRGRRREHPKDTTSEGVT